MKKNNPDNPDNPVNPVKINEVSYKFIYYRVSKAV